MHPEPPHPPARRLDPAIMIATCGGIGWIPVAPGTFGSLAGLPLSVATGIAATWIATRAGFHGSTAVAVVEAGIIAALFAACVPIATRAADLLASKDPGPVVIDEVIAVPLVLTVVPPDARNWPVFLTAFLLFRIFDITKPPPCRRLERLPHGFGVMADDMAAALYAAACLALGRWQGWL